LLTIENVICATVVDVLAKHFHVGQFLLGKVKTG
jgi:hypothetical protein